MPKFRINLTVTNNSGVAVTAHVGASLVGALDWAEYYNKSDDIKRVFYPGRTNLVRYLNTDLGKYQKYKLIVALWEGEKEIGKGIKYASVTLKDAVEKKKKINKVNMTVSVTGFLPSSFTG